MLRTIIADAYTKKETIEIAEALEDLCSPIDNYGWSSAGIYCYWNYETREILYIGLAVDLTERFKQHNGFYPSFDVNACKREKIDAYFENNEKLGFSIIVQSVISQAVTHKVREVFHDLFEGENDYDSAKIEIQRLEGVLLQAFKTLYSRLPKWNKINGSISGQTAFKPANQEALAILSLLEPHILLAKATLRELSKSALFQGHEDYLHGLRLKTIFGNTDLYDLIRAYPDPKRIENMIETGYLNRKLPI